MNYRKIWVKANGPIPVDAEGRSYEIHHIDGNRSNNNLDNLLCLSIKDHFELHYNKGEYFAANLISQRLGKPLETGITYTMTERQKTSLRESKLGDRNPMKNPETRKKVSDALRGRKKPVEVEAKRLTTRKNNGKPWHTQETKLKMKKPKEKVVCNHCGIVGGISQMKRWHFDNCKQKQ